MRQVDDGPEVAYLDAHSLERGAGGSERFLVADPGVFVAADRDVELSLAVHSVEAVVAGLVQIDGARRPLHVAQIDVLPVQMSDLVVVLVTVPFLVDGEEVEQRFQIVPHDLIGVDELAVVVKEESLLWQSARIPEVEKDRAAADKWFEVAAWQIWKKLLVLGQ